MRKASRPPLHEPEALAPKSMPLARAAACGDIERLRRLLAPVSKARDDLDRPVVRTGNTPLMLSVIEGQPAATRLLVEAGANAFLRNKGGEAALHIAADMGQAECLKALLPVASLMQRNAAGFTALDIGRMGVGRYGQSILGPLLAEPGRRHALREAQVLSSQIDAPGGGAITEAAPAVSAPTPRAGAKRV